MKKVLRALQVAGGDVNVVVRRGAFKGIWNVEPGTFELYDLGSDPFERSNVSGQRGALADSLRGFAEAWLASGGAGMQDRPATAPGELDEETLDNLRSLGYVE